MQVWRHWVENPQKIWLRRVLFQIHLWTGLCLGIYIALISISGGALVYRNELYRAFSPQPVTVTVVGNRLTHDQLVEAVHRLYPGNQVSHIRENLNPSRAIEVKLMHEDSVRRRLFDPYTGEDLGDPLPAGFRATAWLLNFHDNLLAGELGRRLNGIGALMVIVLCVTGAVIWWPGVRRWRRSLTVNTHSGKHRFIWSLHSTLGFWFLLFILIWGVTGAYLCFPQWFADLADLLEPIDPTQLSERTVDKVMYWLAYLHFGRFGGWPTKLIWAAVALVPPAMFITGLLAWWGRVARPALTRSTWRQ